MKHYASLDGFRGVAVLLVVCYHLFPYRELGVFGYPFSAGWVGVDLFFVLSGFLITGILFDTQHARHFLRHFYMRRTLRLLPVYLVFVVLTLVLAGGSGGRSWAVTLAYLFYGSNVVRLFAPAMGSVGPVTVAHLWSLAVEEQFYLVWPWIVLGLGTSRRILAGCVVGIASAFGLRMLLTHLRFGDYSFVYVELPTRADALLAGGAIAMLVRIPKLMAKVRLSWVRGVGFAAAAGFCMLSASVGTFYFGLIPIERYGYSLVAVAASSLLLLATIPETLSSRLLALPLLRFFGRYSYGLYLIHYASHGFAVDHLRPFLLQRLHPALAADLVGFVLLLGGSLVLAMLSYHFLELPFLGLKRYFGSRRVAPSVVI